MNADKVSWNVDLIRESFHHSVRNLILSIPIFQGQQDRLVWHPSSTGVFSVHSSY